MLAHLLPEPLRPFRVARLSGADEVVISGVDSLEYRQPLLLDQIIDPLLRGHAPSVGGPLHFGAVLINAGEEPNLFPALAVPTGQHITGGGRIGMPDMWRVIYVIDRCRQIKSFISPSC